MALKHHTVIFVPHARAKLRKWRVSSLQLGVIAGSLLVATTAALFISWSYFTTTIDRESLDALRTENNSLRQVNDSFDENIVELTAKLEEYEERTRQLAILAGIESFENGADVGIGGGPAKPDRTSLSHIGERSDSLAGALDQVQERLDERSRWIAAVPTLRPVRGITTSGYGNRRDPIHGGRAFHNGIDISAPRGAPVYAAADGIVTRSGRNGGLGLSVFLSHGYGLSTRYAHLSKLAVNAGQEIERGDLVGYVGNTGRSTGYHLHYEVRVDGKPTNPIGYILDSSADWR